MSAASLFKWLSVVGEEGYYSDMTQHRRLQSAGYYQLTVLT
jgi:hypothetical protein